MPTLSTSLKTRRKLSPANFLRSSIVHIPLARSVANSSGYCDTSSSPLGVLKQEKKLSFLPDEIIALSLSLEVSEKSCFIQTRTLVN